MKMKKIDLTYNGSFCNRGLLMMAVTFILVLVLGSCAESLIEKEDPDAEVFVNPAFSISEDASTYTSLSPDLKILWQRGDQIGIFCSETEPEAINERAILHQAYIGQNRGVFKSEINWGAASHRFYVYYPWKSDVGSDPRALKHSIQRVQTQNEGNSSMHIGKNAFIFARSNETVPSSGDIALDFIHTTCIFEISFKSDFPAVFGKPLTRVVLKDDNGATLSGDYTFNITSNYATGNMPAFTADSKCDSVILDVKDAYMPDNATDSLKVYLVVNPAYMRNAIIKYTVDGIEYTLTKSVARQLVAQKVYKVMAKVDYSELSVSPSLIFLSPTHPSAAVTVQSTSPWMLDHTINVAQLSGGMGSQSGETATFTRNSSQTNFTVYGSDIATIRTVGENPKYATVRIENLFLSVPEELYIGNPVGADTTVYIPDIVAFGGNSRFVVDGYSSEGNWLQSIVFDEISGKLKAKVLHNSTNSDRPGTLTIHHVDDPSYQITVPLLQNEFVYVPEFKFFVLDIQWCKRASLDVDIAFLFEGNSPRTPLEDIPVGWGSLSSDSHLNKPSNYTSLTGGVTSSISYVNYTTFSGQIVKLLNWGGDATQGQGETVYFDAEAFHNATDVPRYLNLGLYLIWYAHNVASEHWTVRVTLSCYKGGVMEKYSSMGSSYVATNYRNNGGVLVHSQSFFIELNHVSAGNRASSFKTAFTYAATITYDRITHYGIMRETDPNPLNAKWSADRALCANGTDTASTPISQEEIDRIENAKKKAALQIF
jgi:hypothetical protein